MKAFLVLSLISLILTACAPAANPPVSPSDPATPTPSPSSTLP